MDNPGQISDDDTPRELKLLQGVFDVVPMGIIVNTQDGLKRERVNDAFCKFVGYTRDEILSEEFGRLTHKDDLEAGI